MKSLLLGSVLSAGIKVVSAGLTFLMFVYLARALEPAEYGRFATMFSLGTIGGVAALLGQHTLSVKVLSGLEDLPGAAAARRRFIARSYLAVLAGGIGAAAVLVLAWAGDRALGLSIGGGQLLGACALILPFALADLVSHQYRAFGSIAWALIPRDVLWRGGVVGLCLVAGSLPALFAGAVPAMLTVSLLLAGLVAAQVAVFFWIFRRRLADDDAPRHDPGRRPQLSLWLWLDAIATMGGQLNVVVAAPFLPPDQLGAYFAAQKTSQLLQLPILAINIVAGPAFARLHARGDRAGLRAVSRRMALLLAVPLALGAAVLTGFGAPVLSLFDPSFAFAALTLGVLAVSYLVMGLGGPVRQLMLMADGERDLVRITVLAEIAGLVLIPLLVPVMGILGAAAAALAAKVIFTVMTVLWCRSRLGVDTSILSLVPRFAPSG